MTITVCKDCQERYPACWGGCPKYLEAKAAYEKVKAENELFESEDNVENSESKQHLLVGSIGRGLLLISDEQMDKLLDVLSVDEFNHYVSVVAMCEKKGMNFAKPHYQAILEMATADRKMKR